MRTQLTNLRPTPTRPRRVLNLALTLLGLPGLAGLPAPAADQPQWGQALSRNMVSAEKGLPDGFDAAAGKNIKWTARLGTQTYSTPVVGGGRVLIGTNNEAPRNPRRTGDMGILLCLDEADGSLRWQLVVPKVPDDPYLDWPATGIVSPATVDGDRVYLVSNRGEVLCLDLEGLSNGNDGPYRDEGSHMAPRGVAPMDLEASDADIIWLFDIVSRCGVHTHDGSHGSILVDGTFLYLCTSNGVDNTHRKILAPDAPALIVLEKTTGRLVAVDGERMAPRTIHCTWSSPSLGEVNGSRLIFFCGGDAVCYAFEALRAPVPEGPPQKLKNVWRFDCDPGAPKENVHEYQDNLREGPSHVSGMPVFHDGRVYVTVGGDIWHGKPQCWLKCIDATRTGDITKTGEIWSRPLTRHAVSTPSVSDGLVYVTDCGRKIHCFDARTGDPLWVHDTRGDIWASTLVAEGKVYAGTRQGDFWILAAGREKRVIGSVDLGGAVNGTAVAANGVLYVTTMTRLYAVRSAQ